LRLVFEELLANYLCLRNLRDQARAQAAPALPPRHTRTPKLLAGLPFSLTAAQRRVVRGVSAAIAGQAPMPRRLQGGGRPGETLVAVLAGLQAVENGCQAAVMAPTEILAEQHYLNFEQWLEPLGARVAFLSGKIKGKKRAEALREIADGSA